MIASHKGNKYFWLGVLLLTLGFLSCIYAACVSLVTMMVLGYLLVFAGISQIFYAFTLRQFGAVSFLFGFTYCLSGILLIAYPQAATTVMTLIISLCFIFAGGLRISAAIYYRQLNGWGFTLAGGIISVIIGSLLYATLPSSGLWLLGTFIAIELIICGMGWIQFGLALNQSGND